MSEDKHKVPAGRRLIRAQFKEIQAKLGLTNPDLARLTGRSVKTIEQARNGKPGEENSSEALVSASFSSQMLLFQHLVQKEPGAWKRLLVLMLGR